ncbi:TniQ family protein [Alicyclobacillus mengziensis]|uniref:TniQ family protein n=1 Tax=Alicyclobacillus mengziensis TaxID=2931921 RepID=A0A9X7W196_9BACL|nr:TniQ family protein [Alicyclobacillus mengziensis]QSO48592.1 TniQ family protein [Alicyclobacillus mengziensis]
MNIEWYDPEKFIPTPPRSRLYNLPLIGYGTAYVESLRSYILRLAEAHNIWVLDLIRSEIQPSKLIKMIPQKLGGINQITSEYVNILEKATMNPHLHLSSLLPWANIISSHRLMRSTRAWCPVCFETWKQDEQPTYEPLLWQLEPVSTCLKHGIPLEFKCPSCGSSSNAQSQAQSRARNGHCWKCGAWLGKSPVNQLHTVDLKLVELHQNLEQFVLISPSHISSENTIINMIKNLSTFLTKGNKTELARRIGISVGRFSSISGGSALPHLQDLLDMCQFFHISMQELFFTPCNEWATKEQYNSKTLSEIAATTKEPGKPHSFNKDNARHYLESILRDKSNFPFLTEIARQLGVQADTLRKNFPELTTILMQRRSYRIRKAKKPKGKTRKNWPRIRAELTLMLNSTEITESVRDIGKRLDFSSPALKGKYPEIYEEITKRYASYREKERQRVFDEKVSEIRTAVIELRSLGLKPTLKCVQEKIGHQLCIDLIKVWREAIQTGTD